MKTLTILLALFSGTILATTIQPTQDFDGGALNDRGSSNAHAPRYTEDGQLIRPLGWRKWVSTSSQVLKTHFHGARNRGRTIIVQSGQSRKS